MTFEIAISMCVLAWKKTSCGQVWGKKCFVFLSQKIPVNFPEIYLNVKEFQIKHWK